MKKEYDSVIKSYHKKGNSYIKIGAFCLVFVSIVIAVVLSQKQIFYNNTKPIQDVKELEIEEENNGQVENSNNQTETNESEPLVQEKNEVQDAESLSNQDENLNNADEESQTLEDEASNIENDSTTILNETVQIPENHDTSIDELLSKAIHKYAIANVEVKTKPSNNATVLGIINEQEEVLLIEEGDSWDTIIYQNQLGYLKKNFLSDRKLENRDIEVSFVERGIDPTKPMVALTFDDGPNPISTTKILDILEKYNVVATFFDLGKLVSSYPDIVKREEELGCEVGCHSYQHKNLLKISEEELKEDIQKSEDAFVSTLGHKPNLYRPPYGNINATVKEILDYPLIIWNVDSLDWKLRNKTKILSQIRKTQNLDGNIILMHSIYTSTAETVEELVPELIEKGYQLVTVSELAYYKQGLKLRTRNVYGSFK